MKYRFLEFLTNVTKIILFPFKFLFILLIYFYKFCISPLLPHTCRFYPTCSTYFLLALKDYGLIKGSFLGFKRILECRPGGSSGFKPLKPNIKGNIKWIL